MSRAATRPAQPALVRTCCLHSRWEQNNVYLRKLSRILTDPQQWLEKVLDREALGDRNKSLVLGTALGLENAVHTYVDIASYSNWYWGHRSQCGNVHFVFSLREACGWTLNTRLNGLLIWANRAAGLYILISHALGNELPYVEATYLLGTATVWEGLLPLAMLLVSKTAELDWLFIWSIKGHMFLVILAFTSY